MGTQITNSALCCDYISFCPYAVNTTEQGICKIQPNPSLTSCCLLIFIVFTTSLVTKKKVRQIHRAWCVHALITSSYTLLLFSLLRRFSTSKLLLLPKKSIRLKATNPVSVDSELAYKDRSRSACRESVCRAISISSLDKLSYKKTTFYYF
jgi:hypothetical protein